MEVNVQEKKINVIQEIDYLNDSEDSLTMIVLNDWNNAYNSKNSPLAKRFSDEFVRNFHLAKKNERGFTENITAIDQNNFFLDWCRPEKNPDIIEIKLKEKLAPKKQLTIKLTYVVKIPNDKFTGYGYNDEGNFNLKNWFLSPSRYENHDFIRYSNLNMDDIANSVSDYDITLVVPKSFQVTSDLKVSFEKETVKNDYYHLVGNKRLDFSIFIEPSKTFLGFKNNFLEVQTNLKENKLNDIQKAIVIDRVVSYVQSSLGNYPFEKITISQTDYERNPFYGLNQLPSFISPFPDEFQFEIKFLKTYLNIFLQNSLQLNPRKDHWVFDGIQVYTMMNYIDEYHPDTKMMGSVSKLKILKGLKLFELDFNEQYSYYYMIMARKNLDQPLGDSKDSYIKFNQQIAGKYRAGLSLKYLNDYIGNDKISSTLKDFYAKTSTKQQTIEDFEHLCKSKTDKNIDWFFETVINSRKSIDYKFTSVEKTKDSISITLKNKTGTVVPMPIYGLKNNKIVFKEWLENCDEDTIIKLPRNEADKIVLNYKNEVPEYNLRNNWKSLKPFSLSNKPLKFTFFRDLENPNYNQLLYVPTLEYNLYNGLTPGLRLHNKTLLDKPFTFHVNPEYATKTKSLTGNFGVDINQMNRDSRLYNIRYYFGGSYSNYAPDANYLKLNPIVYFRIRQNEFRDNRKQLLLFRQVIINREESKFTLEQNTVNYSVFNVKYFNTKTELIHHTNFVTDLQLANSFGKASVEFQYRNLFENNKQLNLRFYAGSFLYKNTNSEFFSFGIDRPTDYLFDYNFYGRSESSGLFSQQFIMGEGGFKSKFENRYANQWITTVNGSFNVWNWVEIYGDAGVYKNKFQSEKFIYDSGVRLNLVTDYFELYFPVYSNNGWEFQPNYSERIRFVVTLNASRLFTLFTRKWF